MRKIIYDLLQVSKKAGDEILKVYNTDFDVEIKSDNSPLTQADKNSNQVIIDFLVNVEVKGEKFPILSEEGRSIDYEERKNWKKFWIVDPLDGTKEFVKKNGEFTVNIALIEDGFPVLGVIYVPVYEKFYFAFKEEGAFVLENLELIKEDYSENVWNRLIKESKKIKTINSSSVITIVASRSHCNQETQDFIDEKRNEHCSVEMISAGSSLKLCLVAEGKAQFYPRYAPTMEWDIAAGQCIVEEAGGSLTIQGTDKKMSYNKENLVNPGFLVKY